MTAGDTICVTDAADGSLRIGRAKAELTRQMKVAEKIARRYRNALRDLAK